MAPQPATTVYIQVKACSGASPSEIDPWPERVWILRCVPNPELVLAWHIEMPGHPKLNGLGCWSSEPDGEKGRQLVPQFKAEGLSFDAAREIAKTKGLDALVLLDDPDKPEIHWVR